MTQSVQSSTGKQDLLLLLTIQSFWKQLSKRSEQARESPLPFPLAGICPVTHNVLQGLRNGRLVSLAPLVFHLLDVVIKFLARDFIVLESAGDDLVAQRLVDGEVVLDGGEAV